MSITFNDLLTDPKYSEMSVEQLEELLSYSVIDWRIISKLDKMFGTKDKSLYQTSIALATHLQKLKAESEKKAEPLSSAIKEHGVENMIFNRKSLPDEIDMSKYIKPEPSIQITDQKAREICAKYFNCPPNEIKIV